MVAVLGSSDIKSSVMFVKVALGLEALFCTDGSVVTSFDVVSFTSTSFIFCSSQYKLMWTDFR